MKCFRKLLKGLRGDIIMLSVIVIFFLVFSWWLAGDLFLLRVVLEGILLVMLLVGGVIYFVVVSGAYRNAQAKLRAIPGFSEARFERETAKGPQVRRMLFGSDAICYTGSGYVVRTIPLAEVIWCYQEENSRVQIYTRDRQKHTLNLYAEGKMKERVQKSEQAARYLLRLIARKNKNAIIGYDKTLEKLYRKDFPQLLQRASGREIVDSAELETEYIQNDYYHRDLQ